MKVAIRAKVYLMLLLSVATSGVITAGDYIDTEKVLKDDYIILADIVDGEDEGWHAEEFDDKIISL